MEKALAAIEDIQEHNDHYTKNILIVGGRVKEPSGSILISLLLMKSTALAAEKEIVFLKQRLTWSKVLVVCL